MPSPPFKRRKSKMKSIRAKLEDIAWTEDIGWETKDSKYHVPYKAALALCREAARRGYEAGSEATFTGLACYNNPAKSKSIRQIIHGKGKEKC